MIKTATILKRLRSAAREAALLMAAILMTAAAIPAYGECECDSIADLPRPVTGVYNVELGGSFVTATYLSPLRYKGSDFAITGSWTKAFSHAPQAMTMRFDAIVDFQNTHNPARNASIYGLQAGFGWGLGWRTRISPRWQAGAGGFAEIFGGALYSTRNGNNPVQAIARAGIGLSGFASHTFRIGRLPMVVSDEIRMPLMSGFFCQEYGESYYEIYLGNDSRLAHFGHPGNAFALNNLLSLKLDFGRTAMQIGYRFDVSTFRANRLKTQTLRNAFVIGVIPGGLGLKQKKQENRFY